MNKNFTDRKRDGIPCVIVFLWFKAYIANADQQKISNEPYSPFKDFILVFIKRFFLLIEIFLKNFNHGQYGLIDIAHFINYDQSLSKSHKVLFIFDFAMFIAKSYQANVWTIMISLNHILFSIILRKFSSKAVSWILELLLKNFNQTVHLINFDQSLSKSHMVWLITKFAMFLANSAKEIIRAINFDS